MDIFVSYSSKEMVVADYVCEKLEASGLKCWMAHRDIPYGSDYAAEIPGAITNCKVFLLLISENAQKSKYVLRELDDAVEKEKFIIPFFIRETKLDDRFQFFLKRYQHIIGYVSTTAPFAFAVSAPGNNVANVDDSAINQLIDRIKKLPGCVIKEPVLQHPIQTVIPSTIVDVQPIKKERPIKKQSPIVCPKCRDGNLKQAKYYPEVFASRISKYTLKMECFIAGASISGFFCLVYVFMCMNIRNTFATETTPISETMPISETPPLSGSTTTPVEFGDVIRIVCNILTCIWPFILVSAILSLLIYIILNHYKKHFVMIEKSKMQILSFQCCSCMHRFSIIAKSSDKIDERVPNLVKEPKPKRKITIDWD